MTPTELAQKGLRVKPLEWNNIGRCVGWTAENDSTHLHLASSFDRIYEVSKGKFGWQVKWRGEYHAKELPDAEAARAAAEADHVARIAAMIEETPHDQT